MRSSALSVSSSSMLGIALADEERPPQKNEESWYGWQTLLVDVTAIALVSVRMPGAERDLVPWVGLGAYALGPPLVHLAHGSPGKAGVSAAIRVLGPIGGAALGFGGTLGYAGAVATDAAVLARDGR